MTERLSDDDLIKSPHDRLQYRRIRLSNGLRVTIVKQEPNSEENDNKERGEEEQDDDIDENSEDQTDASSSGSGSTDGGAAKPAAVALGVTVGHFHDPPEFPGLAHLLEHMLFIGRPPDENSWESFLSEHGGWSNASTSEETTLYFYEIHPDYLAESLTRFVQQFLIDPPLCAEAISREILAVDCEFQEGVLVDEHRSTQILCQRARPSHPFCKFGWGNQNSLRGGVEQSVTDEVLAASLLQFHRRHYVANQMNLAVMVPDLDLAEKLITATFATVRAGPVSNKLGVADLPFDMSQNQPNLFQIESIKESYTMELVFQLPNMSSSYDTQSCSYWGEVLGDEGVGSAISLLRARGLASSLEAGLSQEQTYQNTLFFLFTIEITLTKQGFDAWRDVLSLMFAYINEIVKTGPQEQLWRQYSRMAAASFAWMEPKEPSDTVETLAYAMQKYPWHDVLSGPYRWTRYDPNLIARIGLSFTPDNCIIMLLGRFAEDPSIDVIEPWFGTRFRATRIDQELMVSLVTVSDPELALPICSPLAPESFTVVERIGNSDHTPHIVYQKDRLRMWHLLDYKHVTPRAHVSLRFYTSAVYESPLKAVCSRLLIMLLEDALMAYLYSGEVADLTLNMRATRRCLEFQGEGFTDKLFQFINHVIYGSKNSLRHLMLDHQRFEIIKARLQLAWSSLFYAASEQISYERLQVLQLPKYSIDLLRSALANAQLDDVESLLSQIRSAVSIDCFIHGNVSAVDAKSFANDLNNVWQCAGPLPSQVALKVRLLPRGSTVTWTRPSFNPVEHNSGHVSYYQLGPESITDRVLLKLLQRISSENCFDCLRTKMQLGYTVGIHFLNTDGILGLSIEIVSASHSAYECERQIERWLTDELKPHIQTLSDEVFENHIEGFIMELEAQDYCLSARSERFWEEITTHSYVFDRVDREVRFVESVERGDLVALLDRMIAEKSRCKLSTHVIGLAGENSVQSIGSLADIAKLDVYTRKIDLQMS
uniref:Peptidase M16 N-terminal domain-containing protein n=1 Tax=Spongospora subterranea TaxID=70186 RepID=A0A0H5R708_9EUKA|eukprot:CRZ09898.1 hypothetical protein [Spongospora subterranea]